MQVSLAMMGFGWTQDVAERCIEVAGGLGYDGIDLWKQYLDTADLAWVRDACVAQKLADRAAVPLFRLHHQRSDGGGFPARRPRHSSATRKPWAPPMCARTPASRRAPRPTPPCGRAASRGCKKPATWRRHQDVTLLLETHQVIHSGPCLSDTSPTTIRLLELADRPNLRVAIQTPLVGETPEDSARQLGRYVDQIQAHNWIGATETTWGELTFLDAGDLDFRRYLRILREEWLRRLDQR